MYIRGHKYSIEEKARNTFGETNVFQFAGYLMSDGTMLNFSYGGYQRDEDHRAIGQFFSNSQGTEAMLKFMRRGNIRVMCHNGYYCFEFIVPPTKEQQLVLKEAAKEARQMDYDFLLEKDKPNGRTEKQYSAYQIGDIFGDYYDDYNF